MNNYILTFYFDAILFMKAILPTLISLPIFCFSQGFFPKATKTVYGLYGRHFSTNYIVDSGTTNLVARKMNISYEAGLLLDFPFSTKSKFGIRTGVHAHMQMISEITYGNKGGYPIELKQYDTYNLIGVYLRGIESSERINISFPIKALYKIKKGKTWEWNAAVGAVISFYTPTQSEEVGKYWIFPDSMMRNDIIQFEIKRTFSHKSLGRFLQLSVPQIEWQIETEAVRKFKKRGALVGGLKASLGTTRLERADFVTWPQYPQYRSKGHYSLNRSYIGLYLGYRFGKNIISK